MKRIFTCITCLLIFISLFAQEITVLRYSDTFQPLTGGEQPVVELIPQKSKRLKNSLGSIIKPRYDSDFSEEMKFCIKSATELWASTIAIQDSIVILFSKEHLGTQGADCMTDVYYIPGTSGNTVYPFSYAVNYGIAQRDPTQSYDAIVTINEDVNWEFGLTEIGVVGKKSFMTAILRSIGISLGFGTSVFNNSAKGILFQYSRYFSPFDHQIVNSNNIYLNTMPNTGRSDSRLTSYVTGDNVYLKYPGNNDYKLHAPVQFEDFASLIFYEADGSLMSYGLRNGDKVLKIDQRTLEGIRAVGWKVQSNDVNIKAEEIPETGIASSYQSYNFSVENNTGTSITSYTWKYELLNKEKQYVTKKSGYSSTFTIDPVDDVSLYDKNFDGDIQGRITLEVDIYGRKLKKFYSVYLETKPTFVSVTIDAITPQPDGYFYDLDVTAIYTGAEYLHYYLEEEYSTDAHTKIVYEPYIAHLHFDALYMDGAVFLDIDINNAYGKVVHSILIPSQKKSEVTPSEAKDRFEISNLQGQIVLKTENYDDVYNLPQGIYLVKLIQTDGKIETHKIFIK